MNAARLPAARRALQQAPRRSLLLRRQTRAASTESSSSSAQHVPAQPATESFGMSFYLLVLGLPATYIIYNLSRDADASSNPITAWIRAATSSQEHWQAKNALHTKMVEQASHDRNLFANTPAPVFTQLRFPEAINAGSHRNHHAGHSRANIEELVAHYKDKAFAEEEDKLRKQREGSLRGMPNYQPKSRSQPSDESQ